MKFQELYESLLCEAKFKGVDKKDWDRMLALVLKGDDGSKVAKTIKNKDKALARYVAGLKLSNDTLKGYSFRSLKDKALALGTTEFEIAELFDQTKIPEIYIKKLSELKSKKYDNRFVGDISKAIIDAGFNIEYLKHNGYALTNTGKEAMYSNGRKWTIGYKTEIDLGDKKVSFNFDAITDEGGGATYYVVDTNTSDDSFKRMPGFGYQEVGKRAFLKALKDILVPQK